MGSVKSGGAGAVIEQRRGEFVVSTDPARLDLDMIHGFLTNCYWCRGIPREVVHRSIEHSLCFGVYDVGGESPLLAKSARSGAPAQVGFARVVSDFATVAYLGDVFVLESHRGRGLSKWMMECIMQHPALQGLRRWILLTRDAHGLYSQFGFTPVKAPERYMELHRADVYDTLQPRIGETP
ncbi:MAG TPA: GNAT family N-acetyltransferase [Terriglobales bacterium]|nr:GNAT family N-acetyltransferase [Terriglobales bacterium]